MTEDKIIIYSETADGIGITIIPGIYKTLEEWLKEHKIENLRTDKEGYYYDKNHYGNYKFFKGKEMKLKAVEKITKYKLEELKNAK